MDWRQVNAETLNPKPFLFTMETYGNARRVPHGFDMFRWFRWKQLAFPDEAAGSRSKGSNTDVPTFVLRFGEGETAPLRDVKAGRSQNEWRLEGM